MKRLNSLKSRLRGGVSVALAAVATYAMSIAFVRGADAKSQKEAKPDRKAETKTEKKGAKSGLSGNDLYAIHCGRCHAERYATEFTAAQWKTIVTEMRVRANIPAAQAKAIIKYLQEDSGTP